MFLFFIGKNWFPAYYGFNHFFMYLLTTYIFLCCKHVLVSVTHCVLRENQCNWFAFNCCLFLVAVILADGNKATGRPRGRSHGRFWPLKAEPTREPREQPTRSKSSSSTHRWASANHLLQAIWFHWPQLWLQPRCHEVGKQGDRHGNKATGRPRGRSHGRF